MPELVFRESCTGSDNDLLTAHTSDTGHTWTKHPMGANDYAKITDANRVTCKGDDGGVRYYSSYAPPSADYSIKTDILVKTVPADGTAPSYAGGLLGRVNTSVTTGTFYQARYFAGGGGAPGSGAYQVDLFKVVSGTFTSLGTYSFTAVVDTTYTLELSMVGSAIKVLFNDTQRISVTDTAITAAGRPGVVIRATATAATNTVGMHLDNILLPYRATAATPRAVQAVTRAATR